MVERKFSNLMLAIFTLGIFLTGPAAAMISETEDVEKLGVEARQTFLEVLMSDDFYSYIEAYTKAESIIKKIQCEKSGKRGAKASKCALVIDCEKQILPYFKYLALQLDEFENQIPTDAKLSNGKAGQKAIVPIPEYVKEKFFKGKVLSDAIQNSYFQKYQFVIFYFAVIDNELSKEASKWKIQGKRANSFLDVFSRVSDKYGYDEIDFEFLRLERICRRFNLAQLDEVLIPFIQIYPALNRKISQKDKLLQTRSCEECSICMDEMVVCKHSDLCTKSPGVGTLICPPCLADYIAADLKERIGVSSGSFKLEMNCFAQACDCVISSPEEWGRFLELGVISNELIVRILHWRLDSLKSRPEYFCCSRADCQNVIKYIDSENSSAEFAENSVNCGQCQTKHCTSCRQIFAPDCCGAVEYPEGMIVVPCPICDTNFTQGLGCDFVKCPHCLCPFNIKTGEIWTKDYARNAKNGAHESNAITERNLRELQDQYSSKK